jgi:penicillin-binding protein 1A
MPQFTKFIRITIWLTLAAFSGAALVFTGAFLYLSPKLPSVDVLRDVRLQTPLRIYSADRQLIGEFGEKRRNPIDYEDVPASFIQAILAAEDDRFFSHHGVDVKGLLRAASQLIATGAIQTGGSTITMQVAKNYFLSQERTFSRKFNEILLALQIERELPKQEILALYLNKIFLGHRAYGVEAAAQVYYGKSIQELSLAQWAMLAGLPKAPSAFNPIVNPERAKVRRDWILGRMHELGYIPESDYQQAKNEAISASYHGAQLDASAPYIAEMVRKEMLQRYGKGIYTDGYKVYTTVNARLQQTAQQAIVDGLVAYDQRHGYRGPEAQFPPDPQRPGTEQTEIWLKALSATPTIAEMYPAIVIANQGQHLQLMMRAGQLIDIGWHQGLSDKRSFIDVNRRGPSPQLSKDIAEVGDLVRVKQQPDGSWQLTQVPNAQAALVSLDADNGAILSLVGGFDFHQSKFNRITQAARQPGSNFKPFIYTAALESGYSPASIINDAPIVFEDKSLESTWRPTNASGQFFGPTRLRQALFKSRNLVSIRLLQNLGIRNAIDYSARFGFDSKQLPTDLSLALGSHSLKPMEIVSGYSAFANGGYHVKPYLIDHITGIDDQELYRASPVTVCRDCEQQANEPEKPEPLEEISMEEILASNTSEAENPQAERIIEARVAFLIDSMLKDVVKRGTARRARVLNRNDLAGKTGTTNGPTDAWFSGYGGGIATTAWLGFDKNQVLGRREYGGSAALPIWIDYMKEALKGRQERILEQPQDIVSVKIDPKTGLLARPGQQDAIFEYFRSENVPTEIAIEQTDLLEVQQEDEPLVEEIF